MKKPTETKTTLVIPMDFLKQQQQQQQQPQQWNSCINSKWHELQNLSYVFFLEYTSRCEDRNNHCPSYAQRGDCQRLPDYMMQTCKMACQFCGKGRWL